MADSIAVAGLKISTLTKQNFLSQIEARLREKQKTFVITPYSEFLYAVLHKPDLLQFLNQADYSIADGVGVLWASLFLNIPFRSGQFYLKVVEGLWQIVWTLGAILFRPRLIKKYIPEKIVGADIIWDIAALCAKHNFSVYLLGGFADTPEIVKRELLARYPKLQIVGASGKGPDDPAVISDISNAHPDVLFVAYGPIRQDVWIAENSKLLPVTLAIGLGGTFDYIAGIKKAPPRFVRNIGLEWLYRLVTQPSRMRRIRNATIGLIVSMLRYKVFMSMPYRKNAVCILQNEQNQILICQRKFKHKSDSIDPRLKEYWQFPQGGIDEGEELVVGAAREVSEETGLTNIKLLGVSSQTNRYDWRNGARPLLFNRLKYRGQDQQIVYFEHRGQDADVVLNHEFESFQWVPLHELVARVHPERKVVARIVIQDLQSKTLVNEG